VEHIPCFLRAFGFRHFKSLVGCLIWQYGDFEVSSLVVLRFDGEVRGVYPIVISYVPKTMLLPTDSS
jgi:hypothetical protein